MASAVEPFAGVQLVPCPYLRARGAYRYARPSREHVCEAAGARTQIRGERQSMVCLAARHASCPTYLAAEGLEGRRSEILPAAGLRRVVSTTPTILTGPSVTDLATSPTDSVYDAARGLVRASLVQRAVTVVLAVLAVGLFIVAEIVPRFSGLPAGLVSSPSPTASSLSPSPAPTPSEQAWATPTAPASPVAPSATPTRSAVATPARTPRPTTTATRRYVVQASDSLWSIARHFGTTVQKIMAANDLTDPDRIYEGQTLIIPW